MSMASASCLSLTSVCLSAMSMDSASCLSLTSVYLSAMSMASASCLSLSLSAMSMASSSRVSLTSVYLSAMSMTSASCLSLTSVCLSAMSMASASCLAWPVCVCQLWAWPQPPVWPGQCVSVSYEHGPSLLFGLASVCLSAMSMASASCLAWPVCVCQLWAWPQPPV